MRESGPTLVVALCVDAALRLLAGVELAAGVRVAVVVQPARANLQTKSPRVMEQIYPDWQISPLCCPWRCTRCSLRMGRGGTGRPSPRAWRSGCSPGGSPERQPPSSVARMGVGEACICNSWSDPLENLRCAISYLCAGRGGDAARWVSVMRTGQPSMVLLPGAWSHPGWHRHTAAPPPDT